MILCFVMEVLNQKSSPTCSGSEIQECDCEMTTIHTLLTRSMPRHFPLEALIADAQDLFMQYPPSLLRGELLQKYDSQVQ